MDAEERFNVVFDRAYAAVRRYAHHRGLTASDADDLVADVFVVAWRRLDKVPLDDPVPWLLGIARNHWRNHLRRGRRDRDLQSRAAALRVETSGDCETRAADIGSALASLTESDRELLRLVAWDGLTPGQVAVVLGCSPSTARVRLHRARRRFARYLERGETRPLEATVMSTSPDGKGEAQ